MSQPTICVFCGTNTGVSPAFSRVAHELGSTMAARDIHLVYGGGRLGLMGAVADASLAAGGRVTGVIPASLRSAEVAHLGLTDLEVTDSMHSRKARMAELADGFIALPGGFGTLEEVLEVLTWNQLGFIAKPVVLLDIEGFFGPLLAMFVQSLTQGFMQSAHALLAQRATTADEALNFALGTAPPTVSKWT